MNKNPFARLKPSRQGVIGQVFNKNEHAIGTGFLN